MKSETTTLTPMMQQYQEIRKQLPDNTFLLFRLGDFYELFHEDAQEGARILGINLTNRHGVPMAGIPYHAADTYINKALLAGKKIAICDQLEAPQAGKLVKRGLTRILTPGTVVEAEQQNAFKNQYLLAICYYDEALHAAWVDVSEGHIQMISTSSAEALLGFFTALSVKEVILIQGSAQSGPQNITISQWVEKFRGDCKHIVISEVPEYYFEIKEGYSTLTRTLGVLSLEGFGVSADHKAMGAAAALVNYLGDTFCAHAPNLYSLKEYSLQQSLVMDPATQRNLELFTSFASTQGHTLLGCIDYSVTPLGSRLLEQYLASPLVHLQELEKRQALVETFVSYPAVARSLQDLLKQTRDIPRVLARMYNGCRNPRELGAIRETLEQLPEILNQLNALNAAPISFITDSLDLCEELKVTLGRALKEDLPSNTEDGGYIADGYDEALDELRVLMTGSKAWLADLERTEQDTTGIRNLKIKYSSAFGYFIEVTNSNLKSVPAHYIRKQTVTSGERYYTTELKEKESQILSAQERMIAKEIQLLKGLTEAVLSQAKVLMSTAAGLARCDVFCGWSQLAREENYCKPVLGEGTNLKIVQGRHPVVEKVLQGSGAGNGRFVPNDVDLDAATFQIALITGPNMAGKSTYIRQVALITLMAQIGCWVPADYCEVGLVDRIFSRVGASDELSRGNSTFMVEMIETANILNNATHKSLIILDEIGRGTSTYDGLSLAWSVAEYLHGEGIYGPKTLFATHYHELTRLCEYLPRVHNFCVAVKEWQDQIVFLHQIIEGAADRSYGIHVAKLAGVPKVVIERAQIILHQLESEGVALNVRPKARPKTKQKPYQAQQEMPLFDVSN